MIFIGGPASLAQIVSVKVDAKNGCAAMGQLEAVEAGVAADVEAGPAGEVLREMGGDLVPFAGGEIAEPVVGAGLRAVGEMEVVEPGGEICDVGSRLFWVRFGFDCVWHFNRRLKPPLRCM